MEAILAVGRLEVVHFGEEVLLVFLRKELLEEGKG